MFAVIRNDASRRESNFLHLPKALSIGGGLEKINPLVYSCLIKDLSAFARFSRKLPLSILILCLPSWRFSAIISEDA